MIMEKRKTNRNVFTEFTLLAAVVLMFAAGSALGQSDNQRLSALRDIEQYSGEIRKYPDSPDAYVMRARAYVKVDRTAEAVDDLTKAIALSKHSYYVAQATTDRGEVFYKLGEYTKAVADFTAVIELGSAAAYKPGAFLNRARALIADGKTTEARNDANEAIKLYSAMKRRSAKKKLGEAYSLRAAINCMDGKRSEARADNVKAASLGAASSKCGLK